MLPFSDKLEFYRKSPLVCLKTTPSKVEWILFFLFDYFDFYSQAHDLLYFQAMFYFFTLLELFQGHLFLAVPSL